MNSLFVGIRLYVPLDITLLLLIILEIVKAELRWKFVAQLEQYVI